MDQNLVPDTPDLTVATASNASPRLDSVAERDATLVRLSANDWLSAAAAGGGATLAARRRLLDRKDGQREFDRAAGSSDRPDVSVKLSGGFPRHLAASIKRLAGMGVPAFRVAFATQPGALSPDSERHLDEWAAALGITNAQRDEIARALVEHTSRAWRGDIISIGVRLALSVGERVWRVPIDLLAAPAQPTTTALQAVCRTREQWLQGIGLLPTSQKSLRFSVPLPFSRLSKVSGSDIIESGSASNWLLTPDVAIDSYLLRYLQEARRLGYSVHCSLRSPTPVSSATPTPELSVERVVPPSRTGVRSGIYLSASGRFDPAILMSRPDASRSPLSVDSRVPFDRFFVDKATHIVAPAPEGEPRRSLYSLDDRQEARIIDDIASGGPHSRIPLGEVKSAVYRFHLDVDLPWGLFEKWPAIRAFKLAQQAYFQGSGPQAYSRVSALLAAMYPSASPLRVRASMRSRTGVTKEGHHLVFPGLLLPNDGRHGMIAAAQLDAVAATALARAAEASNLTRFLAHVVLSDHRHLHPSSPTPLTYRLRSRGLARAEGAVTATDLTDACTAGIVFDLRDRSVSLSTADNASLVNFAVGSMGPAALSRYLNGVQSAPTARARQSVFRALARRCRWEIVRRAHYFDHSIYGTTMGLRLLGTTKPGEPESRYLPADGTALTPSVIIQHSIRATKGARPSTASATHSALLLGSDITPGRPAPSATSLEGLRNRNRLSAVPGIRDLVAEFSIEPKSGSLPAAVSVRPLVDRLDQAAPAASLSVKIPPMVHQGEGLALVARYGLRVRQVDVPHYGRLHLHPPKQPMGVHSLSRRKAEEQDVIVRVRVFIPSPIVDAPGNDFAGDDRDTQFAGGTSRFEGDFAVNPATGEVTYSAHWGVTEEYDSSDTHAVDGKPDWWRDLDEGAEPVASDQLGMDESNVSATASINDDGDTSLTIGYSGANPLMDVAPAIDGTVTVTFNDDGTMSVSAAHDGFPATEVYVNGQLVHEHDPVASGDDPTALFGDDDIVFDEDFPEVPPRDNPAPDLGDFGDVTSTGQSTEVPIDVVSNIDGSYTLGTEAGSEDFMYDADAGGWIGDADDFIAGDEDLFEAADEGMSLTEALEELAGYLEVSFELGGKSSPVGTTAIYEP